MNHAVIITVMTLFVSAGLAVESVGQRPYELEWAGKTEDDIRPLIDFETMNDWDVRTANAEASFEPSREVQLWGNYVAKFTYRQTGQGNASIFIAPKQSIRIDDSFDAVSCWIKGNNWSWHSNPKYPRVSVSAVFESQAGKETSVLLGSVRWEGWFQAHTRLTREQSRLVESGASFKGFRVTFDDANKNEGTLYFDNLAAYKEEPTPLSFKPRPQRGVQMLPGQNLGLNIDKRAKLPFPNREETILPTNLCKNSRNDIAHSGKTYAFRYSGSDGSIIWKLALEEGPFDGISINLPGQNEPIKPCNNGGLYIQAPGGKAGLPDHIQLTRHEVMDGYLATEWLLVKGNASVTAAILYRILDKSFVIDVIAPGGNVSAVHYGHATGFVEPRLITMPYRTYKGQGTPAIIVSGTGRNRLFFASNTDWYRSNASILWAKNEVNGDRVTYDGGTRYYHKTDGNRNDCVERLFLTVAPEVEEVLPNIPNPPSPWRHVVGRKLWRSHGVSDRSKDAQHWRKIHRYGITELIIVDHESMWRDGGESYTFRTQTAPGKGGDESQIEYGRILQKELGYRYGPYVNFTDIATVNEFWNIDRVAVKRDGQLLRTWDRCYGPKPALVVEMAQKLLPVIQDKFQFDAMYCDVHTCWTPSERVDYDHRVPGAGTQSAVYYAYGELFLLAKKIFNGPVYSEGGIHWQYAGLVDGNYAQDAYYNINENPWIVDFDLLKMHSLSTNFGMGSLDMFYRNGGGWAKTAEGWNALHDRFLAATVAFGHPGFLTVRAGMRFTLRGYYMLQQLQSLYTQANAVDIRYVSKNGELLQSSEALARGTYKQSQVVVEYDDGTIIVANGNKNQRLRANVRGHTIDLPPSGFAGWNDKARVSVVSADRDGSRYDYADTPAYIYIDGRGKWIKRKKAASDGQAICRILPDGYEVIPIDGSRHGFAIAATTAVAIDADRNVLGPATLNMQDGLTYIEPVEGAFSYKLNRTR